jgi:surfeit locus 1 family protein
MQTKKTYLKPILMIFAVIICLAMVRLGFWQLDRAEQKRAILRQSIQLSEQAPVDLESLLPQLDTALTTLRFRQVSALGHYLADESILIDNQVLNSQVGYALLTPFKLTSSAKVILVDRGWLSVGGSREKLPEFDTTTTELLLTGRLNYPYPKPPIWNDKYAVSDGMLWQTNFTDKRASMWCH